MRESNCIAIFIVLFVMSACSNGSPKEVPEHKLLTRLAEQGSVEAQYRLGQLLCCGEKPLYDNAKALDWYCKAAKKNDRRAQFEVGTIYENAQSLPGLDFINYHQRMPAAGEYVPYDKVRAYMWYSVAAAQGHTNAIAQRDAMTINGDEIIRAKSLLESWQQVPCGSEDDPFLLDDRTRDALH